MFYENLAFAEQNNAHEQVYDIPRTNNNKNNNNGNGEAIYINQNFEDDLPTYDTPRNSRMSEVGCEDEEGLEDHIECDYDVPKVGLTITIRRPTNRRIYGLTGMIHFQEESNKFKNLKG